MASTQIIPHLSQRNYTKNLWLWALAVCPLLLFAAIGLLILPRAGFEVDEVMFVYGWWHPTSGRATVFHHHMPSMLMSYVGAVKSWLYAPIISAFGVSEWSVRVPVLLLALATVALGGVLMRSVSGRLAALFFIWLLATDVTFLFTSVFDWGPVAIQNFLLIAGLFVFEKWGRERREWLLFLGGFLFGLAIWDKALFAWDLSGVVIALLLVNGRSVIRVWKWKRVALVALGFIIGAYPLIQFNWKNRSSTVRENTRLTLSDVPSKARYLKYSLDGVVAERGVADGVHPVTEPARSWLDRLTLAWSKPDLNGISSWRTWLFGIIVPIGLILAHANQRRWILFFLIAGAIGWFESALTVGAGGSIHHTVLTWPLLYGALALSFAAIAQFKGNVGKAAAIMLAAVMCVRGIQTFSVLYANFISFGNVNRWTDADKPLAAQLLGAEVNRVIVTDWAIANVVAARTADRVAVLDEFFEIAGGRFDKTAFEGCAAPHCMVVSHVKDECIDAPTCNALENFYTVNQLIKSDLSIVKDSIGTPVFEIHRLKRVDGPLHSVAAR
jgi:Dolichyl-phosphate-mannose-protein mannosyltransferase